MRRSPLHTRRAAGLAIGLAAALALSGCGSTSDQADESTSAPTSSTPTSSAPAALPSTSPSAEPSPSVTASEEVAPEGYRFVQATMLGLTMAIPEDMVQYASGYALTTMTDEEIESEAEAEGKTVEQFHARWDNVDLVAYSVQDTDPVLSVELTLAPNLTEVPSTDVLIEAATDQGLENLKEFELDTVLGTAPGFFATSPVQGGQDGADSWVMASLYAQTADGVVFTMTLYTPDQESMDEQLPIIVDSWATVGG